MGSYSTLNRTEGAITHIPRDKMAAMSQSIFSNAFTWKKGLYFDQKAPIDSNTALDQINGLAPDRRQAIIWTNADQIHLRIYVALGGDELR